MDARVRTANPGVDQSPGSPVNAWERGAVDARRAWKVDDATVRDAGVIASCIGALADELVAAKGEAPVVLEHGATTARTARYLRSRSYRAFIARQGRDAIGVVTLRMANDHDAAGRDAWIEECFVAPGWRGRGVGSDLVGRALAGALERGCRRVEVTCPPLAGFAGTRRFYEREGFHATGPRTLALSL